MEYLWLVLGLIVLIVAGEFLVKGAVGIALKFNISTLVIGMTIVAFGTSAPELLVSVKAAIDGHPEISVGNVLGSNIANLALVLGLTTVVLPINVQRSTIRLDWPIMMLATIAFSLFIINGLIDWWEGILYIIALITFNFFMIKKSSNEVEINDDIEQVNSNRNFFKNISFVIIGVVGLAFGANWLLDGAVQIALNFGVSEYIIGATIVAFGTSVPELVTSLVAAFKKQTDISIGNLIGSNIFNLLAVLGITSVVKEIPVSVQVQNEDVYWLLGISLLIFPLMIYNNRINRLSGLILVVTYIAYIYFVLK
ncbi:MAG: calcium/sodium antiporter [Flavobacteriales bacterium]|nr:calcium/sodium antiporter [Flavobacteriales bacterium]